MKDAGYNPAIHWLAVATAAATFPLIFMGGLVTSHHAGMSVPDWPNSYGYNMFLFPPSHWVGGILYEHTHRLMGSAVGILAMLLCGWAWVPYLRTSWHGLPARARQPDESKNLRTEEASRTGWKPVPQEALQRWLALAVLGAVIFQGVLGGLRVVLVKLDLAIMHACVAQAFFCLAALAAVVSSRWWIETPELPLSSGKQGQRVVAMAAATVGAIYLQLIVGATMRHFDAGLAIPDLPLAYGKMLPPMTADALRTVNHARAWDLNLDPVTLWQVWLHFGHRIGAMVVSFLIVTLIALTLRLRATRLSIVAGMLAVLLAAQLTLGVFTVVLRKPADLASAHVAVGALVLVTSFALMTCAARMYDPRFVGMATARRARGAAEPAPRSHEMKGVVPA